MRKTLMWAAGISAILLGACSQANQSQQCSDNTETTEQGFTSLKDSYNRLAKLPNVTESSSQNIKFGPYEIKVEKNAVASGLDSIKTCETGDAMYAILDDIPMKHIVNGATNNINAGFVYANTLETGKNEVLIVAYGQGAGYLGVTYGTADGAALSAIQRAPLAMEGYLFDLTLDSIPGQQVNLINFFDE